MAGDMSTEVMRHLLATTNASDNHGDDGGHDGGHEAPFTFEELLYLCLLLWIVFAVGKLAAKYLGLPELVGQILAGIMLGPHGIEMAPKPDALMLIGELGLVLMVLEAGIEVELSQLAVVGARGVMVAVIGSLVPLAIGTTLSSLVFDMEIKSALAVGASLAPTSMGISLKVLEEGKVLSTPTGQLIIAAAVIDDVIALVLLAQLEALEDPTPINFMIPIISSLGFVFVLGYAAVKIVPGLLAKQIVPRLPGRHVEDSLLVMVLLSGTLLMTACHYGKSSHLLGAFLGGLMFCTLSSVKSVWHRKVLGMLQWLVRVFFSCSIAFEVPIRDLWNGPILSRAAVFILAAAGKLVTGAFAKPYTHREACTIGFAMAAWGEFAFIVATASREAGTMDPDAYGAVILVVLLSAIYSPLAVKMSISGKKAAGPVDLLTQNRSMHKSLHGTPLHHVYYACSVQCQSRWGLTDKVLKGVHDVLKVDILDFRIHNKGGSTLLELYLRDRVLLAPDTDTPGHYHDEIEKNITSFKASLEEIVGATSSSDTPRSGGSGTVEIFRWMPDLDEDPDHDDAEAFNQVGEMFASKYDENDVSVRKGGRRPSVDYSHGPSKLDMMLRHDAMHEEYEELVQNKMMSKNDQLLHQAVLKGRRNSVDRDAKFKKKNSFSIGEHRMLRNRKDKQRWSVSNAIGEDKDSHVIYQPGHNNPSDSGQSTHEISTVTLSGAAGANLALEIKKQLGQSDMAELQKYASLAMRRDQQRLTTNPTFESALPPLTRGPAPAELSGITLSGAAGADLRSELMEAMALKKTFPSREAP
mmetsp:Transcript_35507/g.59848  ORF Transcript_35507/g.59848 Transcript_35507/m.59848 type:complete len:808 (-) Transcript_35507:521-2944(-)|eukprot:CAMPEP_0198206182 /NCGR_PEP_ID=MMETSP1445-20131203/9718_1 /TAXON_ID=36898 /ORGANISM="Pyramimonas sp., Strain CCMP2087" /LENGTH=807 /DNA_ID=CAMNT_0043878779 /DNA_START=96 /DNA_END=2519 /DNA_ORIENTATION=+